MKDLILSQQSPITGLLASHIDWPAGHVPKRADGSPVVAGRVHDNLFSIMSVWALALAYRRVDHDRVRCTRPTMARLTPPLDSCCCVGTHPRTRAVRCQVHARPSHLHDAPTGQGGGVQAATTRRACTACHVRRRDGHTSSRRRPVVPFACRRNRSIHSATRPGTSSHLFHLFHLFYSHTCLSVCLFVYLFVYSLFLSFHHLLLFLSITCSLSRLVFSLFCLFFLFPPLTFCVRW